MTKPCRTALFLGGLVTCLFVSAEAGASPSPPKLRLDGKARPTGYAAELTIDPARDDFSGKIDITLQLSASTRLLWLNASHIVIEKATLADAAGSSEAQVIPGGEDFAGFELERDAGPGAAKLHIDYAGTLDRTETAGLFKQKDGGDWYVFSQFEPIDARRAFPCFDEPSYKVPWQLTLHVPNKDRAVSNTSELSETPEAGGMKTVRFRETRPLPSYLIALGVGPFDVTDAGTAGANHTPLRILSLHGKGSQAAFAAKTIGPLLDLLEGYFGIPYPYEKLDSLVIPQTVGFGAMENAGLITYAESLLLAGPGEQTVSFERRCASVAAHEMAHQWTGDLVTMAWWDDIWLNESFANWMENKIIRQWKPEWGDDVSQIADRSRAMDGDTLVSARKIRQPIESKDDILNAFDNITYGKGAAVLSMFESWMGEKKFQAGVRGYLRAHEDGNATAQDFLGALEVAGPPEVAKAFSTFLEQAGTPLLTVAMSCSGQGPASLRLSQKRFLPAGSKGSAEQLWGIPVCVRESTAGREDRFCTLLDAAAAEISLPRAGCPAWALANDGEVGYYRALYTSDLLDRLWQGRGRVLTPPERVGLVGDLQALAEAGAVPRERALAIVPELSRDPSRHVVLAVADVALDIRDHLVPERFEPNYQRFLRASFGAEARDLGFLARAGESQDASLLRPVLVPLVAIDGEDPRLGAEADRLARRWLRDRTSTSSDLVAAVLTVASRRGGRELFDLYRSEAKRSPARSDRRRIFEALGAFRDPALRRRAFGLLLDPDVDPREAVAVLFGAVREGVGRQAAYDFLTRNFDAIAARLPVDWSGRLIGIASGFCDEAHRRDVESFFGPRTASLPGSPRILAQTEEKIGLCEAATAGQLPGVEKFLKKY